MYQKTLALTLLSSILAFSAPAASSFAAPGEMKHEDHMGKPKKQRGMGFAREVMFVRMLKQFDNDKNSQISKSEAESGFDKLFVGMDSNKDDNLTPGEMREFWEARMKNMQDTQDMNNKADSQDEAKGKKKKRKHHAGGNFMRSSMMIRQADTDENGQISRQEAKAAADRLFDFADQNKDGSISIDDMPDRPFP